MANANYTAAIQAKLTNVKQAEKLGTLLLGKIDTESAKALKYLSVSGNTISFWKDASHSGTADFTVDFPTEYFLDQTKTVLVQSFEFETNNTSNYPGATDPNLDGKPVMVLAVKGTDDSVAYSFVDMTALVDTPDIATDNEFDEMLIEIGLLTAQQQGE